MKRRYWASREGRLLGGIHLTDEQAALARGRGVTLVPASGDGR